MNGAGTNDGMIDFGDLDAWSFTAWAGDTISLNATELVSGSPLYPWVRLYGRDGTLVKQAYGPATDQFTVTAPAEGSYLVVVADGNTHLNGSGTYELTVNGLTDGYKILSSFPSGANFHLDGIGGVPNADYILVTSTNVGTPRDLWTPVVTNQFNAVGVFSYTNSFFDPAEPKRFFRFKLP